jgi:DNA-binding response OmpR family regulator
MSSPADKGTITVGALVIDVEQAHVTLEGRQVSLSAEEYALLRLLATYANRVVTRTELIERIWGPSSPDRRIMLEAHMRCLLGKIERDPARPRYLRTVPGIGFELVDKGPI